MSRVHRGWPPVTPDAPRSSYGRHEGLRQSRGRRVGEEEGNGRVTNKGQFENPYDIAAPAGAEGWRSMYPEYLLFGEEMRERDEEKLWFFDQMHNPEPLYPFDLMMPESWLVSLNQYTTRIWNLPDGARHRAPYRERLPLPEPQRRGRPGEIAAKEPIFLERARHYFENWDAIYDKWVGKATDCIERLKAMRFEALAEREPEATVLEARGTRAPTTSRSVLTPAREHARDGLLPLRDAQSCLRRLSDVPRILPGPLPGHHRRPRRPDGGRHRGHPLPARR